MTRAKRTPYAWVFARRTLAAVVCLTACSVYSLPDQPSRSDGTAGVATSGGTAGGDETSPTGGAMVAGGMATGGSGAGSGSVAGGVTSAGGTGAVASGGAPDTVGNGVSDAGSGGAPPDTAGTGGAPETAGSGGASGMTGSGGTSQPGPATYRYVKLLATSELGGNVWSAVAELQVMTTGGAALDRKGWSIRADSEELVSEKAPATNAIDGDTSTYWHTHWQWAPNDVNDTPLPHYLIVDLGTAAAVTGFSYLPRQNSANGRIKDWAFYASNDGTTWGTPLKSGAFAAGSALQTVKF